MISSQNPATTASSKGAPAAGGADGGASVTKRLTSELMGLMMSSTPGVSAFPKSDSNLFVWAATITGAEGTPYASLTYRLTLTFPSNYPFAPPAVRFDADSPCFHPNVALDGSICLDILQDKWSAVMNVQQLLISLQSLLGEPNNASPLNTDASDLWGDQVAFKAAVLRHYRPLA